MLAIGLSEVAWILREIRKKNSSFLVYLEWPEFARAAGGIFLWEALVSGAAKKGSHQDDARAAAEAFISAAMAGPPASCISCDEPYSLIGAALLRAGWVNHPDYLSRPSLAIKA